MPAFPDALCVCRSATADGHRGDDAAGDRPVQDADAGQGDQHAAALWPLRRQDVRRDATPDRGHLPARPPEGSARHFSLYKYRFTSSSSFCPPLQGAQWSHISHISHIFKILSTFLKHSHISHISHIFGKTLFERWLRQHFD